MFGMKEVVVVQLLLDCGAGDDRSISLGSDDMNDLVVAVVVVVVDDDDDCDRCAVETILLVDFE
jgi:hypothetical protein